MTPTVVHFTDSSEYGGAERVVAQLLEATDRERWRPVLFHHDEPGIAPLLERADALSVPRQVLPRMMTLRDLGRQRSFINALREFETAVFHAHLFWPLSCKYGLVAAKRAGIPAILATSHVQLDLSNRPTLRFQPRLIARAVDRYLAVSQGVAGQLRDQFHIAARKIRMLPNGVDCAGYRQDRNDEMRRALAGDPGKAIVLTAARLAEQKGHRDLIEAAAQVENACFLFAGDGPEKEALLAQARSLRVDDRVVFLGQRDDIPELLACADLFVLPSLYEGMPLSVLEAMAARVPVIVTDIPGNNELITHGKTGILTPPKCHAALAEAINSALNNPSALRPLTDAAYQYVCEKHSLEHTAGLVVEAYEKILSEKGRALRP